MTSAWRRSRWSAGLAAGGLGAAIKYAPKRHVDPFAAATSEDPDDVMPDDEPLPDWAGRPRRLTVTAEARGGRPDAGQR